jgi:Flp pilus assembly protein TadB
MSNLGFLLLLPVLAGMVLVLVTRSERRQQFVQQRLTKLTADESEPAPLSLVRKLHRAPLAIFQLPRKFAAMLSTAFEAAGNRIGLLHLLIAGLVSAIIVIAFAGRVLALDPGLVLFLGLAAAQPGQLFCCAWRRPLPTTILDVFPDALDLIWRAVKAGLPMRHWQWQDVNC